MIDWIKNIFKRNKKKVGAVIEPSKPWPRSVEQEECEAPNQRPKPTPNPRKAHLPPKREGVYFNHPNQQTNNDDNFILGVVVGAATDSAILGGLASGSISGGLVGDIMNDGCLGDCDSGSSWDSGGSCDSGSSFGD